MTLRRFVSLSRGLGITFDTTPAQAGARRVSAPEPDEPRRVTSLHGYAALMRNPQAVLG